MATGDWATCDGEGPGRPTREAQRPDPGADQPDPGAMLAAWVAPMLAEPASVPDWLARSASGWVYERKLDGLRCLAVRNGTRVELWSRNHNSFTRRFPEVAVELAALPAASFALDGELVAVERGEVVGFSALQRPGGDTRTAFAAFDLVHVLGRDVTRLGLADRKRLLAGTVACGARVQTVEMLTGGASSLFQMACAQGWEGLVAKRSGSTYVSGRSGNWRKLKCSASQELVVGGWTEPRGARSGFGALLVGYYERGLLRYAGKVGTGFSEAVLRELHGRLESLARPASPFADQVRERGAHWVEPALVAAVAFTEWTTDGRLRHPRYQGLRTDKDPWSVMRELPAQHGRSKELR